MLKQSPVRIIKVLDSVLAIFFVISVLAATVSAQNVTVSTENGNSIANGNSKEIAMKKVVTLNTDDGKDIAMGKVVSVTTDDGKDIAMETNDGNVGMKKIVGINTDDDTVISINRKVVAVKTDDDKEVAMGKIAAVKTDDGKEVALENISQYHFLKIRTHKMK
jgi:hypothetical protein